MTTATEETKYDLACELAELSHDFKVIDETGQAPRLEIRCECYLHPEGSSLLGHKMRYQMPLDRLTVRQLREWLAEEAEEAEEAGDCK